MKVLLLGASGQLGTEWRVKLSQSNRNYELVSYSSSDLDITQYERVEHELETQKPDVLINCAAYTKVDEAEDESERAFRINAAAVDNLARACHRHNIKLVHFSTDYIFAGTKEDQQRFPDGYPETHRADPINVYGHSKWKGEEAIRNAECRHLIMRVSWLCGAYGSNFVKTMLQLADSHKQLRVVGDQIGSPTFTHALVQNTLTLLNQNKSGTYHYTSEGKISWADFAEGIFEIAAREVDVEHITTGEYPTKAKRPFFSKLSTHKIEQVEGITLKNWKIGLEHLINQLSKPE